MLSVLIISLAVLITHTQILEQTQIKENIKAYTFLAEPPIYYFLSRKYCLLIQSDNRLLLLQNLNILPLTQPKCSKGWG